MNDSTPSHRPDDLGTTPKLQSNEIPGRTRHQGMDEALQFIRRMSGAPIELPPGYQFVAVLGRGGMGVVYRAIQTDLGREVALKMILSGEYASEEELSRFESEIKLIAAVKHPNVVQVHHAGRHNGMPFLDLEYLPDGSLSDLLRDGPLAPADAARIVEPIARGVAACHAIGIVHRDLKPGNVLLSISGQRSLGLVVESKVDRSSKSSQSIPAQIRIVPKVADFGLAKRLDTNDGVTRAGIPVGTPSYMPPEQARGDTLDARADVYAIGAILYATLTGRPPFQSPSVDQTIRRVLNEEPLSIREQQPSTPRDLETICLKCLAKDRNSRYASASDLADDLERWLKGEPIRARRASLVERGWKLIRRNREWTAVFLSLVVGFGVAVQQAFVANRARQATAVEAKQKGANSSFFIEVLSQSSAARQAETGRAVNPNLSVKEALDFATKTIGSRFEGQPAIEADVRANIGRIYHELAQYEEASTQFRLVDDLLSQTLPPHDPRRLRIQISLADCFRLNGQVNDARAVLATVLILENKDHIDPMDWYKAKNNLGLVEQTRGNTAAAESCFVEALEGRRQLRDAATQPDDRRAKEVEVARSMNNLGVFYYNHSRYADAEPYLKESFAIRQKYLSESHPDTISTMRNLADLYYWMDRPDQAGPMYRSAFEMTQKIRPNSEFVAVDLLRLAQFGLWQTNFDETEALLLSYQKWRSGWNRPIDDSLRSAVRDTREMIDERKSTIGTERSQRWIGLLEPNS